MKTLVVVTINIVWISCLSINIHMILTCSPNLADERNNKIVEITHVPSSTRMTDLSHIIFAQIGPQMGQIWDFLRSVSVHFGAGRQNALKLILKSPTMSHLRLI